ncbi:hypothetical protein HPB52_010356 [Rhipicephalus sanguineus]|uniref:EGF-like domain-containing protein n=1 Tax=Rhipicephalus sanguineus TaxID=34632 RepID=A0A9D4PLM7_RHISA|nr:hypothetical protein HPB52_010356 [Rhipicephalus sanguineus]
MSESRTTVLLLLLLPCGYHDSESSRLSIRPIRTDTQLWAPGSAVRLPYVVRTSADANVTCTRDGKTFSRFVVRVPRRRNAVVHTVEHALFIPDAAPEHAGRYACWARTQRDSGSVAWQVQPVTKRACVWSSSCEEKPGMPCEACECAAKRQFYGKNRLYGCYAKRHFGISLRLKETPRATFLVFNSRRRASIFYELTTYGDTQVTWTVEGHLLHSHTTLYDSRESYVTFWERIVFRVLNDADYDRFLNGFLMAHVRGTKHSASLALRVRMNRVQQAMICGNDSDCDPIGAVCKQYTRAKRCKCELGSATRWTGSPLYGHCSKPCSSDRDCGELGNSTCSQAGETRASCVCQQGFYLKHNACLASECASTEDCLARYGPSECVGDHCECFAGYVYRDGVCSPSVCLDNNDCEDGGGRLRCLSGRCICHHEFDVQRASQCSKSSVGKCSTGTCRIDGAECRQRDQVCICKSGYRAVNLPAGRACLKVSCKTTDDCRDIALATCNNGMCTCLDYEPPRSMTCSGSSALTSAELLVPLKLAGIAVGMTVFLVALMCITFTCMKSKEDYVSTLEDDQPVEDEGALMAAKRALDAIQEQDRVAAAEPPGEEPFGRVFMRSFFPRLSDALFGLPGEEGHISFGNTPVSENTIDI